MDVKVFKKKNKIPGLIISAKNHLVTLSLFLLFISGLVTGSLMIRFQSPVSSLIVSMFRQYNGLIVSNGFLKNFINLLSCNMFFVIALFFLGFSALGSPIICLISFIKGVGIGIVSSFLYKTYMLSGFGYCSFVFYPQQTLNMLALMIGMNESYVNSKMIFKTISASSQSDFQINMYIKRFIFIAFIELVSSLIGAIMNTYMAGLFIK